MKRLVVTLCQVMGGLMILALTVIVVAEVVARNLFDHSFLVADEYAGYLVVAITFMGIPYAMDQEALLRVDALIQRLRNRKRILAEMLFNLVSLAATAVLGYQYYGMVTRTFARGTFAPTPAQTPLWIPQSPMTVGMVFLGVVLLARIVDNLRGLAGGKGM